MNHFIRGFFDGDGTVYFTGKYNQCTIYFVGRLSVMKKVKNIEIPKEKLNIYKVKNSETYELRCGSKKEIIKFKNYIYSGSNIYLDRKFNRLKKVIPKQDNIDRILLTMGF